MVDYVLTYVFNKSFDKVLLITKERPDWQKGLLNGIGGKIEENETPIEAIKRELLEESGINVPEENFCFLQEHEFKDCKLYVFYTSISPMFFTSKTDEKVTIYNVDDVIIDTKLKLVNGVIEDILAIIDNHAIINC